MRSMRIWAPLLLLMGCVGSGDTLDVHDAEGVWVGELPAALLDVDGRWVLLGSRSDEPCAAWRAWEQADLGVGPADEDRRAMLARTLFGGGFLAGDELGLSWLGTIDGTFGSVPGAAGRSGPWFGPEWVELDGVPWPVGFVADEHGASAVVATPGMKLSTAGLSLPAIPCSG